MARLTLGLYDREAAVNYANYWAYKRNPKFYSFNDIGGDCTNFVSQCIYAGCGVMNYTPTYGWYYININERAPAWTSVEYLHRFLVTNEGVGPFGKEVAIESVKTGDIAQFKISKSVFHHSVIITSVGDIPTRDNILIASHSYDSKDRALSTYDIKEVRYIHIEGYRQYV